MKIVQNISRYITIIGLFVLPLVPLFVFTSFFFPYITGKAFAFRIIVEVILAAWGMLAILDARYRPKLSLILWTVIGLVTVSTLASIFGANLYRSFWSNFERMEGLITYFHLLAYFIVLISVIKTEKMWRWLLDVSLGVSLILLIIALKQWLGATGGFRADATFGNPIYLAVYALIHFFLALFVAIRTSDKWPRIIYGIIALLQVVTIYLTATRSAMLGLVGGIFVAILLVALFERQQKTLRRFALGALVVIVLATGGFWLARDSAVIQANPVLSRLANISLADATTRHRLIVWKMGWQGFQEKPILGWGPENFNLVFNKYYDPALYGAESWFDRSHNILIDWLVHAGLVGFLAYLSLFGAALYAIWKQQTWRVIDKSILIGLLAAYFVNNLVVFDNLASYLLFFALLAYLHMEGQPRLDQTLGVKAPQHRVSDESVKLWAILPIVGLLIFCLYYFNGRPISANEKLIQAISPTQQQFTSQSELDAYIGQKADLFKQIFAAGTFANGEAREQLVTLTPQLIQSPQVSTTSKQEFVSLAGEQMMEQIKQAPNDARSQLFLGTFLVTIGDTKDALTYLEAARALSPHKQQILFELISTYYQTGDKQKALALAQEAYDLNPNVADAKNILDRVKK